MSQNGKGSKRRPKNISTKQWDTNWTNIFHPKGIRVLVLALNEYGYIGRRITWDCYEIHIESSLDPLYLSPSEFSELKDTE